MDINQLNVFLEVCKYRSFYQTAKILYMTPQGVSKKIKNLEDELGIKLFERDTKGLKLTQEGNFLYQNSNHLITEYNTLMQEISYLKSNKTELINLRVATDVLCTLPSDLLLSFTNAHPEIELMTIEDYEVECENSVYNETDDLALTIFPMENRKFNCYPIVKKQIYLLANKNHPLTSKTNVSFHDLNGLDIIAMDFKYRCYLSFDHICQERGIFPHIVDMTNSIVGMYHKVYTQNAVGFSVEGIVDKLNFPEICTIPIDIEEFSWDITLITKRGKQLSNATKTLINYILKKVQITTDSDNQ